MGIGRGRGRTSVASMAHGTHPEVAQLISAKVPQAAAAAAPLHAARRRRRALRLAALRRPENGIPESHTEGRARRADARPTLPTVVPPPQQRKAVAAEPAVPRVGLPGPAAGSLRDPRYPSGVVQAGVR